MQRLEDGFMSENKLVYHGDDDGTHRRSRKYSLKKNLYI